MTTSLNYNTVTEAINEMGLGDFSQATIRDIQSLSRQLEEKTGQPIIHLEMGVPGLQPSQIAIKAEQEALASGCATQYPPNGGMPRLKKAAAEFVKAFIGVDIDSLCCIPTTGSMQGTYATFTAIYHAMGVRDGGKKDTVLLIQPGFPVRCHRPEARRSRYSRLSWCSPHRETRLHAQRRKYQQYCLFQPQ